MGSPVTVSDKRDNLVCPKPRHPGLINTSFNEPISPMIWQTSNSNLSDFGDSKEGSELLGIILSRGGYTVEQTCSRTASPSPFLCGSPPSRVSNPLIQDARFGDEFTQISPRTISIMDGMPASHHHLQGKEHVVGQILVTNQSLEWRGVSIVLTGIAAAAAYPQWLRFLDRILY